MHKPATAPKSSSAATSARTSPAAAADFEKCPKCGLEALLEVRGQGVEGRVSRVQRRGEPALGRDEVGVSLHPSRQRLAGRVLGCQNRRGVRAGINFATEDGRDEVGALRKVAVNGADADAGLLGDLSHRRVHARGREHRLGRLEQRVDVALGVGAHGPIRTAPRLHASQPGSSGLVAHHDLHLTNGTWFRINTESRSASSQISAARRR